MCKTESEYFNSLRNHASDTCVFLGNKMKPERERSVCRGFLRAVGVAFEELELIAPTEEPADVAFRTARFQIREILEPERKRGDEWKKKEAKYAKATSLAVLLEPYSPPVAIELHILVPEIVKALSEKAKKYGIGCNGIDMLVYINLRDRYLAAQSKLSNMNELNSQGWRSVSFIFPPYGVVLFAEPTAPDFLVALKPGLFMEWKDIDTLFEA
ncbi:MAG: DUF1780 domain-containing protein [Bacteroidetes bacterium]|nr:DUF1780 domain-containing protein [Bacteroidota bacterium]